MDIKFIYKNEEFTNLDNTAKRKALSNFINSETKLKPYEKDLIESETKLIITVSDDFNSCNYHFENMPKDLDNKIKSSLSQ